MEAGGFFGGFSGNGFGVWGGARVICGGFIDVGEGEGESAGHLGGGCGGNVFFCSFVYEFAERCEKLVFYESKGPVFVCIFEGGRISTSVAHFGVRGGGSWRPWIEPFCTVAMASYDGDLVGAVEG